MRALYLMVVVCCGACGGRTVGDWYSTNAQGGSGATGGNDAAGASSVILGGSGATTGTTGGKGGSGAKAGTGGASIISTGGSAAKAGTGGATTSATGGKGGSGAKAGTGGATISATTGGSGAKVATGGAAIASTGGKSSATTSASGGKGGSGGTGGGTTIATTGGSGGSGGTGGGAGTSSITSCTDSFPFLGTWEGNILDFYFEPQQALKLVLSADASGVITGKLTWGAGAPPPAPQSADIPYPPGYWEQQTNGLHYMGPPEPWPGFAYTLVRGAGCDTTFRFGVSTSELWQDWCALQIPIDSGSYGWGCTLLGGSGSSNGTTCTVQNGAESQTYPLWKCEACGSFGINGGVCACDQNGCFANTTATQTFDLTYSVSSGTDILSGPDPSCGDCTVRLARTSN